MPSFAIAFSSRMVDLDAELLQRLRPIGELGGKQDVRRLVDEVARDLDAFGDREALHAQAARAAAAWPEPMTNSGAPPFSSSFSFLRVLYLSNL